MLASLLHDKRLVICSGAGGVGKTTTAAALALAGAAAGRRAVVLTIDPAKRLADALGLPTLPGEPAAVPRALLEEAGAAAGGSLHALMLDPKQTFDALVRRQDPAQAGRILQNRLYQQISGMLAGMQEYTAGEKLYELAADPRFDLVVVDTPPTRNALDFLEAPGKLSRFLDEKVLRWFLPDTGKRSFLLRRTGKLVGGALGTIFGEGFAEELAGFLAALGGLTATLRAHAEETRRLLASPAASFLLVTAPGGQAVEEALFFRRRLVELALPFGGFLVNRLHPERPELSEEELAATRRALEAEVGEEKAASVLERLVESYRIEQARALAERTAIERLRQGGEARIVGIPRLETETTGALRLPALIEAAREIHVG